MEARVEYELRKSASVPRVCLAVKLPAEVIRALAQGTNAALRIQTPKGGSLVVGDEQYEVTWQNEALATVDCYRLDDGFLQQIGSCAGKAVVVPRLDAPKQEEIKARTDETMDRTRKRKVEIMELGTAPPAVEARRMATPATKATSSHQAVVLQPATQQERQPLQQLNKKKQATRAAEQQAKTTWICLHSVPVAATRQAVLDFLEGIEVRPNGVHASCWQSDDFSDPNSGVCQIFVECTNVVGAQLALQRRGEEISIGQRHKGGSSTDKTPTKASQQKRVAIPMIDTVTNMELPWVKAFSVTLAEDSTSVSSVLACLVGKVPLSSLAASPMRLSQCSRLRVQQHKKATLPAQKFSQQLRDDICADPDVNVYIEAYQLLADIYEQLRDELLVLHEPGSHDVLLGFASKQADFMKQKWIEMFNRTTLAHRTNP